MPASDQEPATRNYVQDHFVALAASCMALFILFSALVGYINRKIDRLQVQIQELERKNQ